MLWRLNEKNHLSECFYLWKISESIEVVSVLKKVFYSWDEKPLHEANGGLEFV